MVDVQIRKHLDVPAASHQAKGQVVFFGLHEKRGVEAARLAQGFGAETHAATDKYVRQSAALQPSVGQMHDEAGRSKLGVSFKPLEHTEHGTGTGKGIIVEKDYETARRPLNPMRLGTATAVSTQPDQNVALSFHRLGRAVLRGVVDHDYLVVSTVESAPIQLGKRLYNNCAAVVSGEDETYLWAVAGFHETDNPDNGVIGLVSYRE